jgi:hypothetical protein
LHKQQSPGISSTQVLALKKHLHGEVKGEDEIDAPQQQRRA